MAVFVAKFDDGSSTTLLEELVIAVDIKQAQAFSDGVAQAEGWKVMSIAPYTCVMGVDAATGENSIVALEIA